MILGLRWRVSENKSAAYEELLTGQVAAALLARGISGLRDLTVWRRDPAELSGAGVWWWKRWLHVAEYGLVHPT
jgi:hypothetical protein